MDFTNINDPAGVKALLDQLRSSQAWQELSSDSSAPQVHENASRPSLTIPTHYYPGPTNELESSPPISSHISSLLSRLKPGGGVSSQSSAIIHTVPRDSHVPNQGLVSPSTSPKTHVSRTDVSTSSHISTQSKTLRSLPFNQALPVIAKIANDPVFMEKLEKMREDQVLLEEQLWKSRLQILKGQEEKLKVAQAKAAIIGAGLTQSDATTLENSFLKELQTFDSEQALPAWDALITKQQSTLEALGVPSMFVTTLKSDREKQYRIVQVLEGLAEPEVQNAER